MKQCSRRNGIHISFYPQIDKIGIAKCCVKAGLPHILLKKFSIQDWNSVDIVSEIKSCKGENVNDGYTRSVPSSLCKEETECNFPDAEILDIDLSLDYYCNAKCSFCHVDNLDNDLKRILYDTYIKTLWRLKGQSFRRLRLTDKGEPLAHKNDILAFLSSLDKDKDFQQIEITTNGTFIDDDFINVIKNSNVDFKIVISLNAALPETRESVMGLSDFDRVFNYGKILNNLISDFSFSFVMCELNENELFRFFDLCIQNNIKPTISPAWIGGIPHADQLFYKESYQYFIQRIKRDVANGDLRPDAIENIQFKPYV